MTNRAVIWSSRWNGPVAVFGLILLVVALLLPAIQQAREAARRSQSKNNLKQIGLSLHNYHETASTFPPGGVFDADGKPFHGWMTFITPYLEASPWYQQVNFNIPWDHPDQIAHFQPGYGPVYLNPSISLCRGDDGLARTHYAGSDAIFYHNSSTCLSDLTSGHSQTLMVGDARDQFKPHKSLREVNLRDSLSDQGIQVLTELPNLEIVRLYGRSVTDRGLEILSQCKRLKHLELNSTALGDTGWSKLADAHHLDSISIGFNGREGVGFSPKSVVTFLDLKPHCKVSIWRGEQISIATVRELAKHDQSWPDYQHER